MPFLGIVFRLAALASSVTLFAGFVAFRAGALNGVIAPYVAAAEVPAVPSKEPPEWTLNTSDAAIPFCPDETDTSPDSQYVAVDENGVVIGNAIPINSLHPSHATNLSAMAGSKSIVIAPQPAAVVSDTVVSSSKGTIVWSPDSRSKTPKVMPSSKGGEVSLIPVRMMSHNTAAAKRKTIHLRPLFPRFVAPEEEFLAMNEIAPDHSAGSAAPFSSAEELMTDAEPLEPASDPLVEEMPRSPRRVLRDACGDVIGYAEDYFVRNDSPNAAKFAAMAGSKSITMDWSQQTAAAQQPTVQLGLIGSNMSSSKSGIVIPYDMLIPVPAITQNTPVPQKKSPATQPTGGQKKTVMAGSKSFIPIGITRADIQPLYQKASTFSLPADAKIGAIAGSKSAVLEWELPMIDEEGNPRFFTRHSVEMFSGSATAGRVLEIFK